MMERSSRTSARYSRLRHNGVTLIELMIVVTLLGLLTIISIPAYRGYSERAHRTEALKALNLVDLRQQGFHNANDTYTDDVDALGFIAGCTEHCVYLISFDGTPDTQSYVARIEPNPEGGTNGVNQSSDEECSWFTIDSLGRKDAENESCLRGA